MGDMAALVGTTGIPALVYYVALMVFAVFYAGYLLSGKLRTLCDENNKEIGDSMQALIRRVAVLEETTMKKEDHKADMDSLKSQLNSIQHDVREGFASQATRIDTLFANKAAL